MKKYLLFLIIAFSIFSCKNVLLKEGVDQFAPDAGSVYVDENTVAGDFPVSLAVPQPSGVVATKGQFVDQIQLTWNQVIYDGKPVKYHIYRRSSSSEKFVRLTGYTPISTLTFTDHVRNGLEVGKSYEYAVRALSVYEGVASKFSMIVSGFTLGRPENISAGFRNSNEFIKITWQKVVGAKYYVIYRAEERVSGYVPAENTFESLGEAVTGESYEDKSSAYGGVLDVSKIYYYYVVAHFDSGTVSAKSEIRKGALLALGAPGATPIISTAKGVFNNMIRIAWEEVEGVNSYTLYRISKAQLEAGDDIGTAIEIDEKWMEAGTYKLKRNESGKSTCVYYDTDSSITSGETFFYRVSSKNNFGESPLSDLTSARAKERSQGWVVGNYANASISVGVTSKGFVVNFPICKTAPSYYVYRSKNDPTQAGFNENSWNFAGEVSGDVDPDVTKISFTDSIENLNGAGININGDKVWYRVIPLNGSIYKNKNNLNEVNKQAAFDSGEGSTIKVSDFEANEKSFVQAVTGIEPQYGKAKFSNMAMDYTIAVPNILSFNATRGDESVKDTIKVTGKVDLSVLANRAEDIKRLAVYLVRTCSYGDEAGVFPLCQPEKGGSEPRIKYSKVGKPLPTNVIEYDLTSSLDNDGNFTWIDPMPDFDDKGGVLLTGMKWNYARWDREAWKHILRKKYVDTTKMVDVDYQLLVCRASDREWDAKTSDKKTGYPALSGVYAAHFAMWMKDTLINRLWHIHIPRYAWSKTVAWLVGTQEASGQISGKCVLNINFLSGTGKIDNGPYSDWPKHTQTLDPIALSVSTTTEVPREMKASGAINTPYYNVKWSFSIWVRDYGLHWGLWPDKNTDGYIKVTYNNRGEETITPNLVYITRNHLYIDAPGATSGKNAHGYRMRDGNNEFNSDFTSTCYFTRINFKYQPVPVTSAWDSQSSDWVMSYEMSNW